eukprot:gene6501-310_t
MKRFALLFVLCLCAVGLAQNYNTYKPGPQVRKWNSGTELRDSDELMSYAQDVGIQRAGPVIIVGVLCFIGILIWTCCRCCGRCRLKNTGDSCKTMLAALLFGCSVAGVVLIIVGLDASESQDAAFTSVPTVIDSAIEWVDDIGSELDGLLVLTENLTSIADELQRVDNGTGIIQNDTLNDLRDATNLIVQASNEIDEIVESAGIEDFRTSFADDVDKYNKQRKLYVNIVLGLLLGLIILEVSSTFLNAYASKGCKPKKNCLRYFTPVIGIASIIILLLLWIVAGALVGVMTGLSDVCIDPDDTIISLSGVDNDIVVFFMTCDRNDNLTNPFTEDAEELAGGFETAQDAILQLNEEINNSTECTVQNETCAEMSRLLLMASDVLGEMGDAIGVNSLDESGNAQQGILALVSCAELNKRYHLVLNVLCGDAGEALGKSTEVILGFAVLFVVVQVTIRLLTDTGLDEDEVKLNQVAPAGQSEA